MKACSECGAEIKQVGAGRARITCSSKCKGRRDGKAVAAKRPRFHRACEICQTQFTTGKATQVTCSKPCSTERNKLVSREKWNKEKLSKPQFKIETCKWCNQDLEISSSFKGVIKYHNECKKPARQSQYRVKSVRRQGIKKGATISHDLVAERDGYKCYLCEEAVDMSIARTSRYGATLDHVTPLSKGGQDTMENVRLAHWICNILKSNKTLEEYRAESR
jgi:5-methylcytosine-specific restriction endonuclease McrA